MRTTQNQTADPTPLTAQLSELVENGAQPDEREDRKMPPALARWTAVLLNRAAQKLRERFEERVSELGIRSRHYGVLILLENGPLTQIEIGRAMWVDRTTMVMLIDDLQRLGLVERGRHPGDRRAYAVTITPAGTALREKAMAELAATDDDCLAALSPDERHQLRTLLCKLL